MIPPVTTHYSLLETLPCVHIVEVYNTPEHTVTDGLSSVQIPQKIRLVTESWLPGNGFVTASLKLKRKQLSTYYQDTIASMSSGTRDPLNPLFQAV